MDGTLCSNMRVASDAAVAARKSRAGGFRGDRLHRSRREQAKLRLLGMKAARPGLKGLRAGLQIPGGGDRVDPASSSRYLPDMQYIACNGNMEAAMRDSDILVTATTRTGAASEGRLDQGGQLSTATSAAGRMNTPSCQKADKIVCDDWQTVKHRTQTVSRCYKDGVIGDSDIYANIVELLDGSKPGRENEKEFIYFNAVAPRLHGHFHCVRHVHARPRGRKGTYAGSAGQHDLRQDRPQAASISSRFIRSVTAEPRKLGSAVIFLLWRSRRIGAAASQLFCLCLPQREDPVHLVIDDHIAFVHTHAGLCEDLCRLCRHGALHTDLRRAVGLIAGAALICTDALFLAVEDLPRWYC